MSNLQFKDENGMISIITKSDVIARLLKTSNETWIFAVDRACAIPVDDLREIIREVDKEEAKNDD